MMSNTSKRYDISHITDIFAIPEDKWEDFVVDLKAYYDFGHTLPQLFEEIAKAGGIAARSEMGTFTWIDDGKHKATVHIDAKVDNV